MAVELRDEVGQVAPQQRLTPGQADLAHAEADEDRDEPRELLERQQFSALEEREVLTEDLARHAVAAAEVAAVGDRDTQVTQRTAEQIAQSVLRAES
jgi:hypothetical protein